MTNITKTRTKTIKLTEETAGQINAALDVAQKGTSVNRLDASDVSLIAKDAENWLASKGVAKSDRAGAIATYQPEGPWAKAYKYGQGATMLTLVRKTAGWYYSQAERVKVYPKAPAKLAVALTDGQKERTIARFVASL